MATDGAAPWFPPLHFTAAEVAANRLGELTADQEVRLDEIATARARGARRTLVATAVWVGVLVAAGAVVEVTSGGPGSRTGAVVAGVGMALLLGVALLATKVAERTLRRRRVSTSEGEVEVVIEARRARGTTYTAHELVLRGGRGRRRFRLPDAASLQPFRAGGRWRVYYVEHRPVPVVLSAEPAPAADLPWSGPVIGR